METTVNLAEAKTNLSEYVRRVCHGERVIVAKNNLPLVELVPYKLRGRRKLGRLAGKARIPKDFCEESGEINALFYGRGK